MLAAEGHDAETIAEITSPIGLPGIDGKEPAVIAVSVAAALPRATSRPEPVEGPIAATSGALRQAQGTNRAPLGQGTDMTIFRGTIFDTSGNPFVDEPTQVLAHREPTVACWSATG